MESSTIEKNDKEEIYKKAYLDAQKEIYQNAATSESSTSKGLTILGYIGVILFIGTIVFFGFVLFIAATKG